MKNYKYLVPVVLMFGSTYMAVSGASEKSAQYENYLKEARRLAKLEIVEDSIKNYESALKLKDSADISVELGEVYVRNGWISEAIAWGEHLLEHFPEETSVYTFLLQQYITTGDYSECFELRDKALARGASSEEFYALMDEIEYVYEFGYDYYDDVSVFGNGLCAVLKDSQWGYADMTGSQEIDSQFAWAGVFTTDGIAPVQDGTGEFYYISATGNKKMALEKIAQCTDLRSSIEKIFPAKSDGMYAYYDWDFNKIAGDYQNATVINGDVGAVEENEKWYIINSEGEKLSSETFDGVIEDDKGIVYRNDRIFAEKDNQIFMIDGSGETIGNQTYEDARLFLEADGYAAVQIDGKWGYVDRDGELIIEPCYEDARSFSYGYAAVKISGKWGLLTRIVIL